MTKSSAATRARVNRLPAQPDMEADAPSIPAGELPLANSENTASTTARNAASQAPVSAEDVYRLIRESAYYKAEARGFMPGVELQDWLEAEAEVKERFSA